MVQFSLAPASSSHEAVRSLSLQIRPQRYSFFPNSPHLFPIFSSLHAIIPPSTAIHISFRAQLECDFQVSARHPEPCCLPLQAVSKAQVCSSRKIIRLISQFVV